MTNTNLSLVKECMTSLDLSAFTGKRHSDVLRDIREMAKSWFRVTQRNFADSEYIDSTGRKQPMFKLEKDEILFIASKYNDELRAMIITRLFQLEKEKIQLEKEQNRVLRIDNDRLWDKLDRQDLY